MKSLVTGLLAVALGSTVSATAYAQTIKLGEVLVVHVLEMKPEVDTRAFETFVATQVAPAWEKHAPGLQLSLVRADRGSRKGQYVLLSTTDTEERHQGYASPTGNSPFSADLRARMAEFRPGFEAFVSSTPRNLEYRLLAPGTAGRLPDVEILGIHSVNVLPDRREAFDRFVAEKLHPAVANLRPDLRLLYYKSVRGQDAGNYILVFALTNQSRDKYWPGGSDSGDLRAAFKPLKGLAQELSTYLVEGSYVTGEKFAAAIFESREWTDFVHVTNMAR